MNRELSLPYGTGVLPLSVPEEKLAGVFEPHGLPPLPDPEASLREALASPLAAVPLRERARGARKVAIAIEDATRPVPNPLLIDAVMEELQVAGIDPGQVKVVVATGLHRPMTRHECDAALGRWKGKIAIENHAAGDPERLVFLGRTKLGTAISINRSFMEADVKITTGDVEYHQFCGFGGGAKCVYPGMANAEAIQDNHARMDLPGTGPGRLDGNPVWEEISEAGRLAGVDFNVSLALDEKHRIVAVRAGDTNESFREICAVVDRMYAVDVPRRADLVVASAGGFPRDIDLYQSQKAMEEATRIVKPGGDVVVVAQCREGSGSELFEAWMREAHTPDDIIRRIRKKFVMGGHKAYQIARELQRAQLYLYSDIPPGRVRSWMMRPLASIEEIEALIDAARSVAVLPQATLTHCRLAHPDERTTDHEPRGIA